MRGMPRFVSVRRSTLDARVERVRQLCLAQPRGLERTLYGIPVFSVGKGKVFGWLLHSIAPDRSAMALRTSGFEEQQLLNELDPALFFTPRYLARWGWIGMRFDLPAITWSQIGARIRNSWILAATPAQLRAHCTNVEKGLGAMPSGSPG